MERPLELARVDYGYLCDLAAARGWKILLGLVEADRRFHLQIVDPERGAPTRGLRVAGIKFSVGEGSLDTAADVLFDVLRERGEV